mmetsp:Transcript_42816/g.134941  ORF Transcript_42816/g.134941 Transcript_42816/m.134941 type:complete len:201 (-) Transcript_42816:1211-1813(-)
MIACLLVLSLLVYDLQVEQLGFKYSRQVPSDCIAPMALEHSCATVLLCSIHAGGTASHVALCPTPLLMHAMCTYGDDRFPWKTKFHRQLAITVVPASTESPLTEYVPFPSFGRRQYSLVVHVAYCLSPTSAMLGAWLATACSIPSSPYVLLPQHTTLSFISRAHACSYPATTFITLIPPSTAVWLLRKLVPELPAFPVPS